MAESMYPKCGKCGEGTLLPFFDGDGRNIYACTKCCAKFGSLNYSNGIVKMDYSDKIGYEERNYFLFCWDDIPNNVAMNNNIKYYITNNFGVQWIKDSKIEKIDDGMTIKLFDGFLFSWDNIPGSDNARLIELLRQNFSLLYVPADAKIGKSADGKTIQTLTPQFFREYIQTQRFCQLLHLVWYLAQFSLFTKMDFIYFGKFQ